MRGKVCVITGATSGIGRETALALGALGADLVLLGRNAEAGGSVVAKVRRMTGAGKIVFIGVDLADQHQVRLAAARITSEHKQVDVLINNAGARNDVFRVNPNGIEMTFACNHLGHFLLTALLIESLLAAPAARVITVSSGSHGSAPADGLWQFSAANYDRRQAYARSKLANILFAFSLAERLKQTRIASNAYDPGGVASNFSRNNGLLSWVRHMLAHGLHRDLVLPRSAAGDLVYLADGPELQAARGCYFRRRAVVPVSVAPGNSPMARELWELSIHLAQLDERIGSRTWALLRP